MKTIIQTSFRLILKVAALVVFWLPILAEAQTNRIRIPSLPRVTSYAGSATMEIESGSTTAAVSESITAANLFSGSTFSQAVSNAAIATGSFVPTTNGNAYYQTIYSNFNCYGEMNAYSYYGISIPVGAPFFFRADGMHAPTGSNYIDNVICIENVDPSAYSVFGANTFDGAYGAAFGIANSNAYVAYANKQFIAGNPLAGGSLSTSPDFVEAREGFYTGYGDSTYRHHVGYYRHGNTLDTDFLLWNDGDFGPIGLHIQHDVGITGLYCTGTNYHAGPGTVSCSAGILTGSGTSFGTTLHVGDKIYNAANTGCLVVGIDSATQAIVINADTSSGNGQPTFTSQTYSVEGYGFCEAGTFGDTNNYAFANGDLMGTIGQKQGAGYGGLLMAFGESTFATWTARGNLFALHDCVTGNDPLYIWTNTPNGQQIIGPSGVTNNGVTVDTNLVVGHISGYGSAPTYALGSGGGSSSGGTMSIDGAAHDTALTVTVNTGTLPATSAPVFTITFTVPFTAAPHVVFSPGNAAAAILANTKVPFVTSSTTAFTFTSESSALAASTTYIWNVIVVQ